MKVVSLEPSFEGFREAAKRAWQQGDHPDSITLRGRDDSQQNLFGKNASHDGANHHAQGPQAPAMHLPRRFVEACKVVACHQDVDKWDVMYRLVWHHAQGQKDLMQDATHPTVAQFWQMHKMVRQDVHNCHAYVRFKPVAQDVNDRPHYLAWYEPDGPCLALAAPHFAERLGNIDWTIMTPWACAMCRDGLLSFGPGVAKPAPPPLGLQDANGDDIEALWHTYYRSIFNPARVNMSATRQHMPQRFWKNMSETKLMNQMQAEAHGQTEAFVRDQPQAAPQAASFTSLEALTEQLHACNACSWAAQATQVVPGQGDMGRDLMVVGEQPGDMEDLEGTPFVGPAGKVFNAGLERAGIDRNVAYVTNAVKHFKFELRGKRRIHQKPLPKDVAACHGFLAAEWQLLKPKVLLCLGTTAALAVFGKAVKLKDVRGEVHQTPACPQTFVTTHPSAILRMPPEAQEAAMAQFVADLQQVRKLLETP